MNLFNQEEYNKALLNHYGNLEALQKSVERNIEMYGKAPRTEAIIKRLKKYTFWRMVIISEKYKDLDHVEVEGINTKDAPDFCDAHITYAELNGKALTEDQLDELNEHSDLVYGFVLNKIY